MNLQPMNPPAADDSRVTCFGDCGRIVWLSEALCDLDGPPFKAYYCRRCADGLEAEARAADLLAAARGVLDFHEPDSLRDQQTDPVLRGEAKAALTRLRAAVEAAEGARA